MGSGGNSQKSWGTLWWPGREAKAASRKACAPAQSHTQALCCLERLSHNWFPLCLCHCLRLPGSPCPLSVHSPPKPHQNQCQSSESLPVPLPNSLLPPCLFHARPICTLCRPQSSSSLSSHCWVVAIRPTEVLVSAPASSLSHLCSMEGPGMTWYTGLTKCQSAYSIPQGPTLPPLSWAAGDTATSLAVHACHPALPADHLHRAGVLRGALQAQ